jgi:hypothetical protein
MSRAHRSPFRSSNALVLRHQHGVGVGIVVGVTTIPTPLSLRNPRSAPTHATVVPMRRYSILEVSIG